MMVGHGSPKPSHSRADAARVLARFRAICLVVLLIFLDAGSCGADEFRLRLSWGGPARQWYGIVRLSEGTIEDPQPLGVEPDEPGSMWLDGGSLILRQRSPRSYDAVDVLVRAPRDASLAVRLTAAGERPTERWIEAPLEQILGDAFSANLDDQGSRLRVARQPGDLLPVLLDSPSMVFAPGDTFAFRLDTTRLNIAPSEKIRFVAQLKNPYVEKAVWQTEVKPVWESEKTVTAEEHPTLHWEVPLNVDEGIYQLTITATQPGWLPLPQAVDTRLAGTRNQASRMLELVVVSPQRLKVPTGSLEEIDSVKLVEEIDPTRPDWWKRFAHLPQLPRLKRLWNGPLGNGRSEVVTHALGPVIRLEPNQGRSDRSWEAYTIPIKEPGRPHLLEILSPSDRPQTFGVSVVEPNETGAAQLANLDTGVDQFKEVVSGDEPVEWRRHRVVFWPKTKTPIVLVTNRRDEDAAFYGPIRVSRIGDHLPRAYPTGGPAPARLFAAYLDRPLFPESFSAEEVFVPPSQLGMDDWKTFYQGGTRLVEYLNYVGFNGLVVSVYADGSTIYPSRLLQPTTRYDTGAYLESGQDPVRKDVLEMLLRLFDREGLQLIPALEFSTPLPELEAILREGGPETEGMVWVGRDGRSWPQVHRSYRGRAPYYNVLHPRVQEAMLNVLRELVDRYGRHRSFAGVAIQLSADGYAQLPIRTPYAAWGLDDDTISRFTEAKGVKLASDGPDRFEQRFQQLASSQIEQPWLAWRAEQLASFYRRAHRELTTRRPGTRLYLAGARMFEGEAMQEQLRPTLSRRLTLDKTMMQVGINPGLFSDPEGPLLLWGETVLPWTSLADQSVPLELESMRSAKDLAAEYGATGALFYLQPQETTLASFDQLCPFQPSRIRLTTQAVPSAAQNRRRFIRTLAHFDPLITVDGGLRVPLGQEDSLRDLIALYRLLPASQFQAVEEEKSSEPVTVRYLHDGGATYLVILNEAGFPVKARVRLQTPSGCRLAELTGTRQVAPLGADSEGSYWDVELEAYDAIGARFSSPRVQISKVSASWPEEIDRALVARVDDLENRRFALTRPREWDGLQNAGFEEDVLDGGQIPGWMFLRGSEANVQVDRTQQHSGNASLQLISKDDPTSVMSLPFKPPKTGRLKVTMWVRSNKPNARLPVRIGVFGVYNGRTFPREFVAEVGDEWSWLPVSISDLPEEGLSELQLRIQLTEPGAVWIDDVRLEDLAFGPEEVRALIKTVYPARETLADGQIIQCIRILESYWPRYLFEHVPPMEEPSPAVVQVPEQRTPPAEEKSDDEKPGSFLGRIRNLVPDRLKFY